MIKVGLTGGIGSGKSTVAKLIEKKGYPVFYSDDVAKSIMTDDAFVVESILQIFGEEAYLSGQQLNRKFLAQRIFSDHSLKEKMNQIVHPAIRKYFKEWSEKHDQPIVFNEAAILFETGAYKNFDYNILVIAPEEIRIKRVMNRDQASREEVLKRIQNQWSDEQKKNLSDFIIQNDGIKDLEEQISEILRKIEA